MRYFDIFAEYAFFRRRRSRQPLLRFFAAELLPLRRWLTPAPSD
jgi:hypothetical protein